MLHKSRSKSYSKLKFLIILPVLAIFLMSFNTEEVYVEKPQPYILPQFETIEQIDSNIYHENSEKAEIQNASPTNKVANITKNSSITKISKTSQHTAESKNESIIIITKTTSDKELDNIVEEQKANGLIIKFKGIERNSDNEITAIKIEASIKDSNANYSIKTNEPIQPIAIKYDSKGGLSIGNTQKSKRFIVTKNYEDDGTVIVGDSLRIATIVREYSVNSEDSNTEDDIVIIKESTSETDDDNVIIKKKESKKVVIKSDGKMNPLYIIDGKEAKKDKITEINPNNIEEINVLKNEAAKKKYGDKGKNGVIEITTKKE